MPAGFLKATAAGLAVAFGMSGPPLQPPDRIDLPRLDIWQDRHVAAGL
ncbi:MAG TPA: hypothetical protein VKV32_05955 [Stellaceae bacterium]|nr:hypothetical protein [Stellaceae bacterium]